MAEAEHNRAPVRQASSHPALRIVVSCALVVISLFLGCRWAFGTFICADEAGFRYGWGRYSAQVHSRNCGATTGWATEVVVQTRSLLGLPGTYEEHTVFEGSFDPRVISISWELPNTLIISYPIGEEGRVRTAEPRLERCGNRGAFASAMKKSV